MEERDKFLKFTNSPPDASDGHDHQQFMFLHDWKVRTPSPHKTTTGLINDFSSIAGKLIHIQPENFQWQHTTFFLRLLYPGICICFVFSRRIRAGGSGPTTPTLVGQNFYLFRSKSCISKFLIGPISHSFRHP